MVKNSLTGLEAKLERAGAHIAELERVCKAFSPHCQVTVTVDEWSGDYIYMVTSVSEVPPEIPAIMGDVLQNLRAALDHLVYRLFLSGTSGGAGDGKHIFFPIFDDYAAFTAQLVGRVRGMRQDAIDAITALKPYQGGNDVLWRLHRLNIIEKHRLLIAVASANLAHSMTPAQREEILKRFYGSYPADHPAPDLAGVLVTRDTPHFPLKAGDLLLRLRESEVEAFTRFYFDIVFDEPGVMQGKPVMEALQEMFNTVRDVIGQLEPLFAAP